MLKQKPFYDLDENLLAMLGWRGRLWYKYYDLKYKHSFEIRAVKYLFTIAIIAYVVWRII